MTDKIELRPPFPRVVDNTMINAFRSCPRRFELMYLRHWKPQVTNVHLHAGQAFAKGLEATRRAFFDLGASTPDALTFGLKELILAYGDFQCPPESAKSVERLCGAFEYYFDVYPLETDAARPKVMPSGKHAVEFSFAEPFPYPHPETGEPIIYTGRSDMIVEMANGTFIEDDKTTSQLGASWANQWEMRAQFTGYCWAARRSGILVDGVLIRGIAVLKSKYNHAQTITYRPEWEVRRWEEQTYRDLSRMQQCWSEGQFDYNLGEACGEYGGCMFVPICKKPNPDEWLDAYFAQKVWNPLTRQEEEIPDASKPVAGNEDSAVGRQWNWKDIQPTHVG